MEELFVNVVLVGGIDVKEGGFDEPKSENVCLITLLMAGDRGIEMMGVVVGNDTFGKELVILHQ